MEKYDNFGSLWYIYFEPLYQQYYNWYHSIA